MPESTLEIHQFPCLSDNYGFLIHDKNNDLTATIDTPEVSAIEKALTEKDWTLTHILNTHHHWDHAGGNLELKEKTKCTIVGPRADAKRIPGIDIQVGEGDDLSLAILKPPFMILLVIPEVILFIILLKRDVHL